MERLNLEGHNAGRFQQRKFVVRSPTRNEAKSSRKNWTEKAQEFGSIRPPKESKYQKGKENGCTELFDRVFYGRKFEMPELDLGSPTLGEASKRLPTLSWSCSEDEYEPPKPDPPPVDVQPVQQVDSKKIDPVENPHNVPLPVTSDDQSKKSQPKQQSEIVAPTFGDARNLAGLASDSFQFSGKLTPQPSVANKAANPPMVFGAAAASGSQDTQQNTGPSISFNGMFSPAVQGRAIPEGRKIARVKRNRTKVQSQGEALCILQNIDGYFFQSSLLLLQLIYVTNYLTLRRQQRDNSCWFDLCKKMTVWTCKLQAKIMMNVKNCVIP